VSLLLSWHTQFYTKADEHINIFHIYIYLYVSSLKHDYSEASQSAPREEKPERKWEWNSDPTYVTRTWVVPDLPHTNRSSGILPMAINHFSLAFYPIPLCSLFSIIHDTLKIYIVRSVSQPAHLHRLLTKCGESREECPDKCL